ncbi:glycoside hydrolase family 55 protein [Leuconostoc citreum]|uniref:glycoside hydrolase family 55 protein n=1 Tax=Leuconostoc citreum TaxID=33964 RepID=UPI00200B12B5|nr:glycoside hydrolase family 55 protein [Leuconostoc citreum]MCK8605128.1 glycoside hydrolase family 55 protein [Leuconostoc citreum]
MKYGNYKSISVLTDSLNNKMGDTSNIFSYQINDGFAYADLSDNNAVVSIRNVSGYLFDIQTKILSGRFSIDFDDEQLANLPAGNYEFQINIHVNDKIAKYPDNGFVPFEVTSDARTIPNALVPQITLDNILKTVDEKIDNYLETVKEGKQGQEGEQGKAGKDGENGKDGKNAIMNSNDVRNFGADATGATDSTQAFLNALASNDNGSGVYIPSGTYIISDKLILNEKNISGQGRGSTFIKLVGNGVIKLQNDAILSNITIDIENLKNGSSAIELGTEYLNVNGVEVYSGSHSCSIFNVDIKSSSDKDNNIGIYGKPKIMNESDSQTGVWGNTIKNVTMNGVGFGIKLDAQYKGWINGNSFEDILIKGFQKSAVLLDSTSESGMNLQVNMFRNIQVEGLPTTPINAIAFNICAGQWNFFEQCSHWNDAFQTPTDREDVIALNFGTSVQANRYYMITNNTFRDCKFEGKVSGSENEIYLNNIINVSWVNNEKRASFFHNTMFYNYNDSSVRENIIPEDILDYYNEIPEFSPLSIDKTKVIYRLTNAQLNKVLDRKYLSYSMKFKVPPAPSIELTVYIVDESGKRYPLENDLIFSESTLDGCYAISLICDLSQSSINDIAYIEVIAEMEENTTEIILTGVRASNKPANNYDKYNIGHHGEFIFKKLKNKPQNWNDLGISLPSGIPFDEALCDIKNANGTFYVKTPIKE